MRGPNEFRDGMDLAWACASSHNTNYLSPEQQVRVYTRIPRFFRFAVPPYVSVQPRRRVVGVSQPRSQRLRQAGVEQPPHAIDVFAQVAQLRRAELFRRLGGPSAARAYPARRSRSQTSENKKYGMR